MRSQHDVIYEKVIHLLEDEMVYLDPRLSLISFSVVIGTNTTYLSQVVNSRFGCNLRSVINDYRIRHARRLLEDRSCAIPMRSIYLHCGYASLSVFYHAFKERVGCTPRQYHEEAILPVNSLSPKATPPRAAASRKIRNKHSNNLIIKPNEEKIH